MLTVADCVTVEPSFAAQLRLKIVCEAIGGEVCVPDAPLHEPPLVLVMEQEFTLVAVHCTCTVFPAGTRSGVTLNVTAGGGGTVKQVLPEQPNAHV